MERRRGFSLVFVVCLVSQTFATPVDLRLRRESSDNEVDSKEVTSSSTTTTTENTNNSTEISDNEITSNSTQDDMFGSQSFNEPSKVDLSAAPSAPEAATPDPFGDDSDESMEVSHSSGGGGGGSNVFSLLRLATSLFPGSSGGGANILIRNMIRDYLRRTQPSPVFLRRSDNHNKIKINYSTEFKKPILEKQEIEENGTDSSESESTQEEEDDNDAAEESNESNENSSGNGNENNSENDSGNDSGNDNGNENSSNGNGYDGNGNNDNGNNVNGIGSEKQDSESNDDDGDEDDDEGDEPPGGGDGQGGGVLGILAGLSGGEDGQSDLGSLLATVSGIVVNLSGDGIDINALIASGLGLFVGLLSGDEQNPGEILASYLLTSLDTISGGGSQNNGAFFGKFLSKLIKGTSALMTEGGSSEENGNGMKMPMTDSAGFLASFLMGLSGDMSKGSSGGSSQPWDRQNYENH